MKQLVLGRSGPTVSAIGLGCMSIGIADVYTSSVRDGDAAVALIRRALDLGITFLDTADIYGLSEMQVGKALQGRRAGGILSPKVGFGVADRQGVEPALQGSPEYFRRS